MVSAGQRYSGRKSIRRHNNLSDDGRVVRVHDYYRPVGSAMCNEPASGTSNKAEAQMLWLIVLTLIILRLLDLASGYVMGYFIHILLVVAIVIVLVGVIQGRRPI